MITQFGSSLGNNDIQPFETINPGDQIVRMLALQDFRGARFSAVFSPEHARKILGWLERTVAFFERFHNVSILLHSDVLDKVDGFLEPAARIRIDAEVPSESVFSLLYESLQAQNIPLLYLGLSQYGKVHADLVRKIAETDHSAHGNSSAVRSEDLLLLLEKFLLWRQDRFCLVSEILTQEWALRDRMDSSMANVGALEAIEKKVASELYRAYRQYRWVPSGVIAQWNALAHQVRPKLLERIRIAFERNPMTEKKTFPPPLEKPSEKPSEKPLQKNLAPMNLKAASEDELRSMAKESADSITTIATESLKRGDSRFVVEFDGFGFTTKANLHIEIASNGFLKIQPSIERYTWWDMRDIRTLRFLFRCGEICKELSDIEWLIEYIFIFLDWLSVPAFESEGENAVIEQALNSGIFENSREWERFFPYWSKKTPSERRSSLPNVSRALASKDSSFRRLWIEELLSGIEGINALNAVVSKLELSFRDILPVISTSLKEKLKRCAEESILNKQETVARANFAKIAPYLSREIGDFDSFVERSLSGTEKTREVDWKIHSELSLELKRQLDSVFTWYSANIQLLEDGDKNDGEQLTDSLKSINGGGDFMKGVFFQKAQERLFSKISDRMRGLAEDIRNGALSPMILKQCDEFVHWQPDTERNRDFALKFLKDVKKERIVREFLTRKLPAWFHNIEEVIKWYHDNFNDFERAKTIMSAMSIPLGPISDFEGMATESMNRFLSQWWAKFLVDQMNFERSFPDCVVKWSQLCKNRESELIRKLDAMPQVKIHFECDHYHEKIQPLFERTLKYFIENQEIQRMLKRLGYSRVSIVNNPILSFDIQKNVVMIGRVDRGYRLEGWYDYWYEFEETKARAERKWKQQCESDFKSQIQQLKKNLRSECKNGCGWNTGMCIHFEFSR